MATPYPSQLELTLITAADLKNVNWRYGELRPYAVAWVDHNSKFTTRVDEDGGTDPSWKEKLSIPIPTRLDTAELSIDVVHVEAAGETKPLVGSVRLSLSEVFDQVRYERNCIKRLKLKRPSGRPQGMIEVRLEFIRNRYMASDLYKMSNYGSRDYGAPAPSGYGYAAAPPAGYASYNGSGYGQLAPPAQSYYGGGGYNGAPSSTPVVEYNTAPPPQPYYGSGNPGYGGAPQGAPMTGAYDAAPVGQPQNKMGGMGAGLAVGAVAGVLGGLALAGGANYVGDKIAEKAAEKVGDGYGYGGYDDDSSDDD